MERDFSQALRGIRANGQMGQFLKEAAKVLTEDELRAISRAINFELNKYKKFKFQSRYYQYSGSTDFMKNMLNKSLIDLSDEEINQAIIRKYTLSKTMVKALYQEKKRRKKKDN